MLVAGGVALGVSHFTDDGTDAPAVVTAAVVTPTPDLTETADARPDPGKAEPVPTWTQVVGPGDSLSGLLAQAGLDKDGIRSVTGALGSAFNLQHLQPGHSLALIVSPEGHPEQATLEIEDGSRIRAIFGPEPEVETLAPQLVSVRRAGETTVDSTIFAALDRADIPTRFATDLELILAETFDLSAGLAGGEHIRLMWREYRSGERVVGDPVIDFAQLDLADGRYEIIWPNDDERRTRVFKDDQLVLAFDQPISGARLSSAFGLRMHPVHGTMRMHSGLDFAAPEGAVVAATQDGKIAYMGQRSGYGTVVEVDHGGGVQTLYAHLSALNDALNVGQRITAGTELGRAGSTGTSTAPHLHYEIRINDKPVSPLADTRLRGAEPDAQTATNSQLLMADMQSELDRLLATRG